MAVPQQPQPNVGDTGRGINGVKMPVNPPSINPQQAGYLSQVWANAHPPAAAPSFGPPQMANYGGAFQNALNAARGNINQSLQASLADIASSQQNAQAALGQLPGQVNSAYGQATGTMNNSLAAMTAAQQKSGVAPLMDVKAFMAPEQAAIAGSHASDLANVPLLQQGINEQVGRERAQAQMAANDRFGQLDMQQASFQQQLAQQQAGFMHDEAMQRLAQESGDRNALRDFNYTKELDSAKTSNATNTNPATGMYQNTGLTQSQLDAVHGSAQYKRFSQLINSDQGNPQQIEKVLASNPSLAQVLLAENPSFFKGTGSNFGAHGMQSNGGYMGFSNFAHNSSYPWG